MQIQNEISHPSWILFQKSLQEGAVPEDWKRTNGTPIFKRAVEGYLKITDLWASPASAASFSKLLL